jgi:hypothetical protein
VAVAPTDGSVLEGALSLEGEGEAGCLSHAVCGQHVCRLGR